MKSVGRSIDVTNPNSGIRKNAGVIINVALPITLLDRAGIGIVSGTEKAASKVGLGNDAFVQRVLGGAATVLGTKTTAQKAAEAAAKTRAAEIALNNQPLPSQTGAPATNFLGGSSLSTPIVVGGISLAPILVIGGGLLLVILLWRRD